ncbi:hypothetical protein [Nocardioides sp. P5_C9_2]
MLDLLLITLADKTPEPEDVKAGWTALIIFLLLAVAVAVLGFSLVKQLRKAQSAKDAGLYGDEPVDRTAAPSPQDADLDRDDPLAGAGGDEPTARPDDGVEHRS